jgi:pimeloyl-ACP methyl ester carboxylesterase
MSAETASKIPGAHFLAMPDLGHFVASENYDAFRPHLLQALALIEESRR